MDAGKFRPNGLMLSYPVITSGEKAHQGSFEKSSWRGLCR